MTSLFQWARGQREERGGTTLPITLDQLASYLTFNGNDYPFLISGGGAGVQDREEIAANYIGYVEGIYKRNGAVFAVIAARMLLFAEARFQWQRMRLGQPGDLFGTQQLALLERPWRNATTSDLLSRALLDVDMAGNFYATLRGAGADKHLRRLRPDWVTIVTASMTGDPVDYDLIGYLYQEGGPGSGNNPVAIQPDLMVHWAPFIDPAARVRGMSWLQPIVDEVIGDAAATQHKSNFFQNGANLGYVVTMDPDGNLTEEQFKSWVATFKQGHEGMENAYKTLFLSAGADVKVVGTNLRDLDLKAVQGAGETRIAAAARIPAILAGFSEGLESATYSNYGQARRAFADMTLRPLWRSFASALEMIVDVPRDARLWYDDRDIPFLQEDLKDTAEIQQMQAATINTLITAGYTPESAVKAVTNDEWNLLDHSGLVSVQLQEPGAQNAPPAQAALPSGSGNGSSNGQAQLNPPDPVAD